MHKVFISYHHARDQHYKECLVSIGKTNEIFIDKSVDTGGISDNLQDETIREKIRDEYLQDSTVTIVLVGEKTKGRKHVDWEIFSSMIDGKVNKKSGILAVNLPAVEESSNVRTSQDKEKALYPDISNWTSVTSREEYQRRHPFMPERIVDNFMKSEAKISVTRWSTIKNNPNSLRFLIDVAFQNRTKCEYDFSRPMRRKNSP